MKKIMILLIRGYQIFVSPLFTENMSDFILLVPLILFKALENDMDFFKGSYLGIRRLLKCHPF